jgi:pSer/pThr/pTyr-binding forkhead associated (FHA) protein
LGTVKKILDYEDFKSSTFGNTVDVYITQVRYTLRTGDTLEIGEMSAENYYRCITQVNQFGGSQLKGNKLLAEKTNKQR